MHTTPPNHALQGHVATVAHPTLQGFITQTQHAAHHADAIEWRLDHLTTRDLKALQPHRPKIPLIVTLRSQHQGGHHPPSEHQRLQTLKNIIDALAPDVVDVEMDIADVMWSWLQNHAAHSQLLVSHHDWERTPSNKSLHANIHALQQRPHHAIKYATMAQSDTDALRVLACTHAHTPQHCFTGIAMGAHGANARLLSPWVGNQWHYHSASAIPAAPGQNAIDHANTTISRQTAVYGLLGDPIAQSIGDQFHQAQFVRAQRDAVYLKWQVSGDALPEAMAAIQTLPIQGFSITAPLKQDILSHIQFPSDDVIQMHACNTLTRHQNHWYGDNTDGAAAVTCLIPYQNKPPRSCHILGLGGTARAIGIACWQQGWPVTWYARHPEKTPWVTPPLNTSIQPLSVFEKRPDNAIVINTIPGQATAFPSYLSKQLHPNMLLLDCAYQPQASPLSAVALQKGCQLIDGLTLFEVQAKRQQQRWQP